MPTEGILCKVKKPVRGGKYQPGDVTHFPEKEANEYIKQGYAEEAAPKKKVGGKSPSNKQISETEQEG